MNILALLQDRFRPALTSLVPAEQVATLLEMIRPAQDAKFGDYQANFAMSLGKQLGKSPREVATQIVAGSQLADLCQPPEIAGPGFINLRLRDEWLAGELNRAVHDERLGIPLAEPCRTIVLDYSSPNVAKPMHVGHIRSTVIGDALCRTLRFLGHRVISDNHLGDWGTQFGMIIYGYKQNLLDAHATYKEKPVETLGRLYKYVNQVVSYWQSLKSLPIEKERLNPIRTQISELTSKLQSCDKAIEKKLRSDLANLKKDQENQESTVEFHMNWIFRVEKDSTMKADVDRCPNADEAVLEETAKLHAGDAENLRLWHKFLPNCRDEIARVYRRLNVQFDHEHGESFYHDRLAGVVESLRAKGLAQDSQGAVCVFIEGFETPMIVQKKDGAFLYATTDLATIQYRMETWHPDAIQYVVDHRQSEHFDKLFAVARLWGQQKVDLQHVKFGTVMGSDGKPYKTREGTAAGLESLLDEAVSRAAAAVAETDTDNELSAEQRQEIAEVVGIGALKYADLSQNRASDYTFSYDKMLLMNGNTATYMQYSYARVRSIFARGGFDPAAIRASGAAIELTHEAERALGLQLLRFAEALAHVEAEAMPHHLTGYLFDLAKSYSAFFEKCPVLKADNEATRDSRLLLCDLTARTIRRGLELLGIGVVEKM